MSTCPNCGHTLDEAPAPKADGRATCWRVRVRLYHQGIDDPVADSDPELAPERDGTTVVRGLPAVASLLAEMASGYHRAACAGLDGETLRHRLKGLRPTLSRRGGNAVWRVPYTVTHERAQAMLARLDIVRETP